ncbi:MAG: ATP synthase F1 subunit delta [Eubacteriales bacterium]|nr:ATP synthase F1 subunit delta [Eubacteriales bacterium]
MTQTARLYGGSLYDLAAEEKLTETIMEQMMEIRQLFRENPDYLKLLSEPSIPKTERGGLIEAAFGAQAERYLVNFLKLLCDRNILAEYAGCCEEFKRRYNVDHNIAEAVVTSAVALSEAQMAALKARLEKISGKQVSLIQKIDASVLAGLKVELEGRQLDGTVQSRLSGISRKMKETVL